MAVWKSRTPHNYIINGKVADERELYISPKANLKETLYKLQINSIEYDTLDWFTSKHTTKSVDGIVYLLSEKDVADPGDKFSAPREVLGSPGKEPLKINYIDTDGKAKIQIIPNYLTNPGKIEFKR